MTTFLSLSPLLQSFLLILLIQVSFAVFALSFRTDKLTDLSYGLTFIANTIFFYLLLPSFSLPLFLILLAVSLWGLRLSLFLFIRILSIKQDKRFDSIRTQPLKFASFWLLQTVTIFTVSLPVTLLFSLPHQPSLSTPSLIALLLWLTGFLIETIADQQKYHFKKQSENKNKWISHGLWRYSQHPNYFGEILSWWSIFFFASFYLPLPQIFLSLLSPIYITSLIIFFSGIPPLQKKYKKKYAKNKTYQRYHQKTSLLIPLPPKKTNPQS